MVPLGESYRPDGSFGVRPILVTLILGLTAAVLSAGAIWLWEVSPIPTLLILTPIFQGFAVGWVMAMLVTKLKIRNPMLVGVIAFLCGLLSIVFVHYGHHLHIVSQIATSQREHAQADKTLSEETRMQLLAQLASDPDGMANEALAQQTGHGGFVGSMILRNEIGTTIKRAKVTGWFLWGVWGVEALIVAVIACLAASVAASQTFCEDCDSWCEEHVLFSIPADQVAELVDAIRDNFPSAVAAVRAKVVPDTGQGTAILSLHTCPGCHLSFADVKVRVPKGKEVKETTILRAVRVSPEMVRICEAPAKGDKPNEGGEATGDEDEAPPEEPAQA